MRTKRCGERWRATSWTVRSGRFFWGQSYGGTHETLLTAGVYHVDRSEHRGSPIRPALPLCGRRPADVADEVQDRRRTMRAARRRRLLGVVRVRRLEVDARARLLRRSTHARSGRHLAGTASRGAADTIASCCLLGLVLGLGWWATPQICSSLLSQRSPGSPGSGEICSGPRGLVLGGAVVGSLPWLVSNATHDWYSSNVPPRRGSRWTASRTSLPRRFRPRSGRACRSHWSGSSSAVVVCVPVWSPSRRDRLDARSEAHASSDQLVPVTRHLSLVLCAFAVHLVDHRAPLSRPPWAAVRARPRC